MNLPVTAKLPVKVLNPHKIGRDLVTDDTAAFLKYGCSCWLSVSDSGIKISVKLYFRRNQDSPLPEESRRCTSIRYC